MKKRLIILSIIIIVFLLGSSGLFWISKSRTFQFFGEIYPRIETTQKFVALTFDDGPTPEGTDEILKILAAENVKATFFVIGAEVEKNPGQLEKIMAAGHEIGNHTYNHERMILVTPSFVKDEVEKTDALIRKAGYADEILFRPPFGKKLFALPFYLSQNNRKSITWDVEPETFFEKTDDLVNYTSANTKNGSIILLHVMYKSRKESMNAVQPIIKLLREKGFEFTTVSALLKIKN